MTMTNTQTLKMPAHILTPLNIVGILVIPFDSYSQAIDCIASRIAARKKTFCVAINPEKIYCAHNDEELAHILCRANFHICDGIGAAIAARILYGRKVARITGVQLFFELIARTEKEGLKVFLLGAKPESNKLAGLNLRKQYPHLQIVGQQDGYFEDDQAVVHNIDVSQADLLFVALGSPRQEKWIAQYSGHIETPFCVGAPLHAVDLIVGDFLEHTFQGQYDYAIVMGVMDYVEDAPRLLGKLSELVSCRAVLSFPVRESIWSLQRAIRYGLRGCPLYFYSRPQLKMLMQSSGFKSFTVERIYRDYFVVAET